jgi:hypothetical protein
MGPPQRRLTRRGWRVNGEILQAVDNETLVVQLRVEGIDGWHLQLHYGHDETALIHEKQVRKES